MPYSFPQDGGGQANASVSGPSRWYGAAVVALAALLFLARLGVRALWASEGRWAEVVREMQLSSNYFWPTINGALYYDKPLLSYWFILAATRLTGGLNEAATRLPSALFGLAGVILIIVMARRLYDRATAAWAGFILATSFSYVFFSRHASADVETTTGVLAALTLFVWHRERQDGWWVLWLWLIMAATALTKGLQGFAVPLAVIGLYSLLGEGIQTFFGQLTQGSLGQKFDWLRRRCLWFFNAKTPVALIAAGACYYLPFAISSHRSHSEAGLYLVFRENVVRFFEPFDHRGPIYLYLYVLFGLMAPWSVFIPAALVELHHRVRRSATSALADADVFALIYFWGVLAFFTLSRSRRSYYLLPILPAAALVVARLVASYASELWAPARRLMRIGYGVIVAVTLTGGVAFLLPSAMRIGWLRTLPPSPDRLMFLAGWLVAIGTVVYALGRFSVRRLAVSSGIIAYLALLFLFLVAMPRAERYRYERSFAQTVRSTIDGNPGQLALYRIWGPGLVYYLAMTDPIPAFADPDRLADFVEGRGGAWVITREKDVANVKLQHEVVAGEPVLPWDSPSESRSRYVLLRVHE
jgi:4-amino-4-deoxy-L-arabinose transferase-like glycosyltransferase